MRKLAFITGTRADYGLIRPVLKAVAQRPEYRLQLIALGTHALPHYGYTLDAITQDGFTCDAVLDTFVDTANGKEIALSTARATAACAESFAQMQPDLVVITGDRYEMLGAATAALMMHVPIAHLYGGDVTEGALDDAIRHAITKMAGLHFCTTAQARQRLLQMGEAPERIIVSGSPALDVLADLPRLSREALEQRLGVALRETNILVTFHPVTRERDSSEQLEALLAALAQLDAGHLVLFTMPNADQNGEQMAARIQAFAAQHAQMHFIASLGHPYYLQALQHMQMVVGNSSSGLYEVPSMHIPTVNIGSRQKGRLKAASVIDAAPNTASILDAIAQAARLDCSQAVNPYGDGTATKKILAAFDAIADFSTLCQKPFYDSI
ncbi:MAG: UDP-N-acetylglucosamine 2-epimerase [Holosporales bacterium]|jgi:UDP-hydrolysing UDP-N-acetyl-D-glucosamine 2-epimerase